MDNIFEILIYLFIIISFLSSFFKKKKTPETKTKSETDIPVEQQYQSKTPQQEEYDLLKEIEKMFKPESSSPEKPEERSIEKGGERFQPASEHFKTSDWHQPVPSEHRTSILQKAESWEEKSRKAEEKRKAVNEKIVKQARMFEKHLTGKKETNAVMKNNIRKKLKEPGSLKEYIIFSEILGKPKALSKGLFEPE